MTRVDAIDSKKTKQELLGELTTMRQRLAELETLVSRGDQAADAPNHLEGWFQTLFECAPDAYYLNTLEAQFVDGNRAAEALLGYQREELIGKSFLEANLLSSNQLPKAAGLLAKSSRGQPTGPDEFVLTRRDGTQVAVEIHTVPAELDGQTLVLGIARDITKRKQMEEQFREAEEQYRTLIENATDAIIVAQNGQIVYRNPADLKLLGYTDEELAEQDFLARVVPEDHARIRRYQQQRLQGKPTPSQYEITVITRDGRRIPVELKPRVIQYRGQPATLVMMRDITARKHAQEALQKAHDELERKVAERTIELAKANEELRAEIAERQRTEEALRASEEKYRDLVENMNDEIFCVDETGKMTYISPVVETISGYLPSEVVGRPFGDFIYPEDLESVLENFQKMLTGQLESSEFRIVTKSGSPRWMRGSNRPIWEDGQVVGLQGILTDITEKKEAEEALRERQYFIEKIADTTPMILYLYDYTEQRNVYVNKQVSAILGYTPEDIALMGSEMAARLLHPDDMLGIARHEQLRDMADGEVRENEYRMRHADGKWRWLQSQETVFSRTATGAVKVVLGTAQDITERRRIERQLQESEARYAGIFHNTADPIFLVGVNEDGTFVYEEFNPPQETITGLSTEEIRGKMPAECFSSETATHVTERYSACLEAEEALRYEEEVDLPRGIGYRVAQTVLAPIRDASGRVYRLVGIARDITERKRAEKKLQETNQRLEDALAERQSLSTTLRHVQEHERRHLAQELHDGVAQTLSGILMHVDLLDSQLRENQLQYDETLTQIHTLLENAIDEVRGLAWTLRPGVLDDLGLADALPGLVTNMTKNVPIKTRLHMSPRLPALPSETETALYRITQEALSNILKHAQASAVSVRLHKKKASVVLTVTDDGRGIPQSQDSYVDPKKRGLGLWSMRERAEEIGGTFSLESTPHKGTKILVTVPTPSARDTIGAPL